MKVLNAAAAELLIKLGSNLFLKYGGKSVLFLPSLVLRPVTILSVSSVQKRGGDDVLDLQNKPGRGAVLCTGLSRCDRLHEEVLSAYFALFINEADSGAATLHF